MPRAILFGFEGGLVDQVGPRLEVLTAVLAEEGIDLSDDLLAVYPFGPPYEGWLASVIARVRGSSETTLVPQLMARAAARYRAGLRDRGPVWLGGAGEFVQRAAAAGLDLGVVTGLPKAEVRRALSGAGLAALFKVVVGAEDLDESDSRAAAYRLCLSRLNTRPPLPERLIHPHEAASIEGSADGVRSAAAAGLATIAIGGASVASAGADHVVEDFADLELSRLDSG